MERLLTRVAKRKALVASYTAYWERLRPRSDEELMNVYVFSAASYLNTWSNNVAAYRYLTNLGYPLLRYGRKGLLDHVVRSGAGIHNRRFQTIAAVDKLMWSGGRALWPGPGEPLTEFRDRLRPLVPGLGLAKLAFVIEMMYPDSCAVTCADRHILRAYGGDGSPVPDRTYLALERHWCETCAGLGLAAPIARHIVWDAVQRRTGTMYWSYVLHDPVKEAAGHYDVTWPRYNGWLSYA